MNQSFVSTVSQPSNWWNPDELSFLYVGDQNPLTVQLPLNKTHFQSIVIDKFYVNGNNLQNLPQGAPNIFIEVGPTSKCKFQPDGQVSNIISSIEPYPGTTVFMYDPARFDTGSLDPYNQTVTLTIKDITGNVLALNPGGTYTIGFTVATSE